MGFGRRWLTWAIRIVYIDGYSAHESLTQGAPGEPAVPLARKMPSLLEDVEQNITPRMSKLLDHLWQEWKTLDCDIETVSQDIETIRQPGRSLSAFAADPRSGATGLDGDRSRYR